jgi:methylase of polypeptide subunit release factors
VRAEPHLAEPDAATLAGLREALLRAGYTAARVAAALGRRPPFSRTRKEVYRRRLADAGELGTLILLFRLGEPVDTAEAAAALAPAMVEPLVDAGLLAPSDGQIAARVELSSYAGLLLAHDRVAEVSALESWHVLFGAASRSLAALTIRRPARRALDLGTGCGVQALLAAGHSEHVVATDLSERALRFTRLNAVLNGIENVECRRGDLFDPVEGERFDLIVSNPPFVVSPDSKLLFRDSELPGDEISRLVVHRAQEHLEDGGLATILCSWIAPPGAGWATPLHGSIDEHCHALLLEFTSAGALDYAAAWTDEFDRWLAYYSDEGIESISTGAVIMRRRTSGGRVVSYHANAPPRENAGDQLLRILDAPPADDRALLHARFRLVEHKLRQEAVFRNGTYTFELTGVEIRGSPLNVRVEPMAVHVLPRLDGSATVADVVGRTAQEAGLDPAQLEVATLTTVRRLYERGFLEPG